MKLQSSSYKYLVLLFFAILYASISLVNHYNFRTYAWDLGLFNNAIYDYAHFKWNDVTLQLPNYKITNTLGDHFSLIPLLVSPLYWLFGSYTLLIFQVFIILFGGFGIYIYFRDYSGKEYLALLAMVHFFLMWGIYSALAFDYHDNVVAAMMVPWFFYYIYKRRLGYSSLFLVLILITKENMALWAFFICLGLVVIYFKDRKLRNYLALCSLFSIIYFISIINLVIPHIVGTQEGYIHFHYTALGGNMKEVLITIVTKPIYVLRLLFENNLSDPVANGIKTELHYVVLLCGGIALLFKPQFFIMLIPIYAQKLFNDDFGKWGINYQYSIEFAPILTIAFFTWINELNDTWKKYLSVIGVLSCFIICFKVLDSRTSKWYNPSTHCFYQKKHYMREFNVKQVYKDLDLIDKNASVSAQSMMVPHLAFRKTIYQFPYIGDADYIVLLTADENKYPLNKEQYNYKIQELKQSGIWIVLKEDDTILILKRI